MAANVAASATPAAPAAPSTEGVEFPVSENPALPAQTGAAETDSEKEKEQDTIHVDGTDDKEDKDEGDAGRDDAIATCCDCVFGRKSW